MHLLESTQYRSNMMSAKLAKAKNNAIKYQVFFNSFQNANMKSLEWSQCKNHNKQLYRLAQKYQLVHLSVMVGPSLQNGVENRRHNSAKETVKDPACIQVLPAADVGTDMTYMFKVHARPCVFFKSKRRGDRSNWNWVLKICFSEKCIVVSDVFSETYWI